MESGSSSIDGVTHFINVSFMKSPEVAPNLPNQHIIPPIVDGPTVSPSAGLFKGTGSKYGALSSAQTKTSQIVPTSLSQGSHETNCG